MKTTVELPDRLFRQAKATAAANGQSLREFFTAALTEKLQHASGAVRRQPWMKHYGALAPHHAALAEVEQIIERECEQLQPEDWR